MTIFVLIFGVLLTGAALSLWLRKRHAQHETLRYSVSPGELQALLNASEPILLVDVRHPLDLLADPFVIPGSTRIAPRDVKANPALVPCDRDVVFYCTCPSDDTSRAILHKAIASGHTRAKFLGGGLEEWRKHGLPVEPYSTVFHLDTAT